jgi:Uncharacterized protein conserved in bacteria
MKILTLLALLLPAPALFAQAQNPVSSDTKATWEVIKGYITKAAEKMPEEHYSFRPTDQVRTFGQLVGHIADAQYAMCSAAKEEKRSPLGIEKTKTTKAELVAALKESSAYCDEVYNGMTDEKGQGVVKLFGRDRSRLGVLNFNIAHDYEHYGNLVTYMRMKGLVPPSSERR